VVDPYETGHFKAAVLNLKFAYSIKDSKQCAQRVMYVHTLLIYRVSLLHIKNLCADIPVNKAIPRNTDTMKRNSTIIQ